MLIAREQMRHATSLENAAAEIIVDDMGLVTQDPDRSRTYEDVTDEDVRPPVVPLRMAGGATPQVRDQEEQGTLTRSGQ